MKMHSLLPLLMTTQIAFATSFYIRPFSEFTKSATNIIHGKLSGIHSENGVTRDGGKTIYTYAKLDIKEVLKGNISGTQIIIRKLGGSKDGMTLDIPSSVEFFENEDGVFFLSPELEDHSYEVTGMELGKFGLEEKNGEQILKGGIFSYSNAPTDHLAENQKSWSITQLKELIRAEAEPGSIGTTKVGGIKKTADISKPSAEVNQQNTSASNTGADQPVSTPSEKEKSPLYFGSTFWYSLATIILTLGVFFYFRRG